MTTKPPITIKMARRLRLRGLLIHGKYATYETPRLKEIAEAMARLMGEMAELDEELKTLAERSA